eukprot:Skav203665  [mRNA]  locus=scaffold2755:119645:122234:- [translate_table: standard]
MIFLALVPEMKHHDTGKYCSYRSWLRRGWKISLFSLTLQDNTIDEGEFTVESDRNVVKQLGEVAVEHKIQNLSEAGPMSLYRFFLARQSKMLGQPSLTWEVDEFLRHFKFPDLESAISDKRGMSAVLCATFAGDVEMVRLLVQKKADLNVDSPDLEELGYSNDWNLLIMALEIRALLDLGIDANSAIPAGRGCSAAEFVKSPEHIQELLRRGADFHNPGMPLGLTPLANAVGHGNLETVSALLRLRCDPNPPLVGLGILPLMSAVGMSRGNHRSVEIVRLLLENRADPNAVSRQSGYIGQMAVAIGRAKAVDAAEIVVMPA